MTSQRGAKQLIYSICTVILLSTVLLRGCNCQESESALTATPPWSCETQAARPSEGEAGCPDGQRFVNGTCAEPRCDSGELACCPGMFCDAGGICQIPASRVTTCDNDSQCETGQRCLNRPLIDGASGTCGWPLPDEAGACETGSTPFNQRCVSQAPCEGGCAAGSVCNIDTNQCETAPAGAGTSCNATCGDSEVLVFADPDTMLFGQCCEIECACETLPALSPGNWGRFSDITVTADSVLVSGYDTTYGDLVLGTFDKASNTLGSVDYIDGVPTTGTVVADPAGPRNGISDAGADAGQHTSLATYNDEPRIAYYDVDNSNLKFAHFDATAGTWTVSDVLTNDDADIGKYTSLVIDDNGIPHVTYYAHRVELPSTDGTTSTSASGIYYARGLSQAPSGPEDWSHTAVELVSSCDGQCAGDAVCVSQNATPACLTASADCQSCSCGQACVTVDGSPTCLEQLPSNLTIPCGGSCPDGSACVDSSGGTSECSESRSGECDPGCATGEVCVAAADGSAVCRTETPFEEGTGMPDGIGLFSSLAIQDGYPTVAYYDRTRGHLRGGIAQFDINSTLDAGFATGVVACAADDDVGQHPSLAVSADGQSVALAYQAYAGEALWVLTGTDIFDLNATTTEVDNGVRDDGAHRVGADASLARDSAGNWYIAYADQTDNDLVLAAETGSGWQYYTMLSDGAFGSFTALAIEGTTAYLSTYERLRTSTDTDASRLVTHQVDVTTLGATE